MPGFRSVARSLARSAFSSRRLNMKAPRRDYSINFKNRFNQSYSRLSSIFDTGGSGNNSYFDNGSWEDYYTEVIDSQKDIPDLNAGQITLLTDYFPDYAKEYCKNFGQDYSEEDFVAYVKVYLGDTYYYAINETIDKCAQQLTEAWDRSYRNDGIGQNLFGGTLSYFSSSGSLYGNWSNALSIYQSAAAKRYGTNWQSNASSWKRSASAAANFRKQYSSGLRDTYSSRTATANSKAAATKFLAENPSGTARVTIPLSYKQAAAKNGKKL